MSNRFLSLAVLALGVLTQNSAAYFRLSCSQIQVGRIDPIVNPKSFSPHAHKISGPSNFNSASTYESLQQANCTSCEIQDDKSAYWTPLLYYQHKNGSFEEVPNGGMVIYYLGRGDNNKNLTAFPPGFRMVSGNVAARSYKETPKTYKDARPIADRVSFACLDRQPSKETPLMTNTKCMNGLRAQIHFQSCWDGVNLYKSDNSHVAYMSGIDNGVCPPTHPVQFVHMFFEVLYGVADIVEDGGQFVFSQGDTTGAGFHGDFMNGWKTDVLEDALKECASDGGDLIDRCAPLQKSHVKNTKEVCPLIQPVSEEKVRGLVERLPGCPKVTSGPEDVKDMVGEGCVNDVVAAGNTTVAASSAVVAGNATVKSSGANVRFPRRR